MFETTNQLFFMMLPNSTASTLQGFRFSIAVRRQGSPGFREASARWHERKKLPGELGSVLRELIGNDGQQLS